MYQLVTRQDCTYCEQAKSLLAEKSMIFEEIQIGRDITRDEVLAKYPGLKTLPIVIKNDVVLGGWAELLDDMYPPLETRNDG